MDMSKNKLIGLSCIIIGIILVFVFNYFYQYAITGAIYYMFTISAPGTAEMLNLHLTTYLLITGFILIIIGTGLTFKQD